MQVLALLLNEAEQGELAVGMVGISKEPSIHCSSSLTALSTIPLIWLSDNTSPAQIDHTILQFAKLYAVTWKIHKPKKLQMTGLPVKLNRHGELPTKWRKNNHNNKQTNRKKINKKLGAKENLTITNQVEWPRWRREKRPENNELHGVGVGGRGERGCARVWGRTACSLWKVWNLETLAF